ncbi:hypothetical protein CSUI_007164, partial [Cystoisospora suis]
AASPLRRRQVVLLCHYRKLPSENSHAWQEREKHILVTIFFTYREKPKLLEKNFRICRKDFSRRITAELDSCRSEWSRKRKY